jgi:hypothetical protein
MKPHDPFQELRALQEQLDPYKQLGAASALQHARAEYERSLGVLRYEDPSLTIWRQHQEQIQVDRRRWELAAAMPSAADWALRQFEQAKTLLTSLERPQSVRFVEEAFDAYQRATAWLNPEQLLSPIESLMAEHEKFRSLTAVADPLRLYREAAESVYGASTSGMTQQVRDMLDALEAASHDMEDTSADSDHLELVVEEADVERVRRPMSEQVNTVALSADTIAQIVQAVLLAQQQLSARDRKIFATYVFPVLVALVFMVLNPYADFIVKQRLEAANKSSEKAIRTSARDSGAPANVIDNFRFVSAQRLDVRQNGRMRSPTIGTIRFGQPLEILRKDGDWTLVHYSDVENGTGIQGWVLSRYLKRYR